MKIRTLLTVMSLLSALPSSAQLGADGYYRIQNTNTTRYVKLIDDKAEVDLNTTSVDLGALQTVMYFDNVVSDASSVIYLSHIKGDEYNIVCQGLDMAKIVGFGLRFQKLSNGHYVAFQEQKGLRKILNDLRGTSLYGAVLTNDATCKDWDILPINDDNYFGIIPDIESGGKYYKSFYSDFAFTFKSSGMKAWYVKQVDSKNGICVVEEITGVVPAATPVFIECSSKNPSQNRLDLKLVSVTAIRDNLLNGVYFDNSNKKHFNRVDYNKSNMRVLGINADGKLGFVTSQSLLSIPANTCYLGVSDAPQELVIMLDDEYQAYLDELEKSEENNKDPEDNAVEQHISDGQAHVIYGLDGKLMNCPLESLSKGVWIVDGRKFIVQ